MTENLFSPYKRCNEYIQVIRNKYKTGHQDGRTVLYCRLAERKITGQDAQKGLMVFFALCWPK